MIFSVYDLPTTRHRVIDETHSTLSVTYDDFDSQSRIVAWRFYVDRGDSRVNKSSRVESPVNRVVSRPATRYNVIAGRRRTWIPERAETGFSGCSRQRSRPRNKLRPRSPLSDGKNAGNRTDPRLNGVNFACALVRILMHAVKTEPARFWRVFGWFEMPVFAGFPARSAPEGLSGGADNGCYGKCENISLIKSFQEK